MTEKQKWFNEAAKLAESVGCSISGVSIKELEIPHDMYMQALGLMSDDNLFSHYKDRIEEQAFEQAIVIKKELDKRNIKIIIE